MVGRKLLVSCIGLQAATAYHATAMGGPLRVHSRMLRSSAPRLALDTEDSKALYEKIYQARRVASNRHLRVHSSTDLSGLASRGNRDGP